MKPALRIVFAPLFKRHKRERDEDLYLHGVNVNRTIWLDPRSSNVLETLIHEKAHADHPNWSEEEVRSYTAKWMRKSSWKRKAQHLRLLGNALIEGEV